MFAEDLAGRIFGFESDAARVFSRLPLTAVRSADLSATRMRRLQPLPKYEGPNSRRVMLQTSRTVILISLTPGMVGIVAELFFSVLRDWGRRIARILLRLAPEALAVSRHAIVEGLLPREFAQGDCFEIGGKSLVEPARAPHLGFCFHVPGVPDFVGLCCRQHKPTYVAQRVMWRSPPDARKDAPCVAGQRHIIWSC